MFDSTSRFLETLDQRPLPGYDLSQEEGFPWDEFQKRSSFYQEAERWVSGDVLSEEITVDGKDYQLYPVHVNPIPSVIDKHTYALFGEANQDDRPLVYPTVMFPSRSQAKVAKEAEDILYRVWWESNGRSIQFENGLISQIYGGCVFQVVYDPYDPLKSVPVRIDNVHPKYFVGRPSVTDMWNLDEAWIVKPVNAVEAARNGVDPNEIQDDTAWQMEHITKTRYEITINGKPASRYFNGEWIPVDTINPFGFVPVVYIPHIRYGSSFYGSNSFDVARGLILELNRRIADFGDAVSVDSHSYVAIRNVNGTPKVKLLAKNLYAIDLGGTTSITGDEKNPDILEVRKPTASQSMQTLVDELNNEIRRYTYVPKVADGEDEGSQRSGLTLAMRMWPLTSHTNTERYFWTAGLDLINRMVLNTLRIKGKSNITEAHTSLRIKENWAPVLPRDREMQVNEVVSRVGSNNLSPKSGMDLLGDVADPEQEMIEIYDHLAKIAKIEASARPATTNANNGTNGSNGTNGTNPQDRPKTASTQSTKPQSSE